MTTVTMTVEMTTRVTKVKEEVEDPKAEFLSHPHPPPPGPHFHKIQDHDNTDNIRIKEEGGLVDNTCHGCGQIIHDQWLLKVGDKSWHSACLRCSVCSVPLNAHSSCFLKYDQVLCKLDYIRLYGTKCSKCGHPITQSDWIRRAHDQVFHLACFACDSCQRQLSTGEEFGLVCDKVLCKNHYLELHEGGYGSSTDGDACENTTETNRNKNRKSKRNRTTFTDEQIHILQANFQIDCNPDGQDLERIADISGLSKRVVQVWFQNARARNKKYIGKTRGQHPGALTSDTSIDLNLAFSAFYANHQETHHEASPEEMYPPQSTQI